MKKSFVLHPFMFVLFPVFFLFAQNLGEVMFHETLIPIAILLGATFLVLCFFYLVFKDVRKAGLLVTLIVLLFFSYGHVFDMIEGWQKIGVFKFRHRYLLAVWSTLFTCGSYAIIRTRRNLHDLTNILNVMSLSLLIMSFINIGVYELQKKDVRGGGWWNAETRKTKVNFANRDKFRDIYYIILDGHASSNILKDLFSYDDSRFIDHLTSKGFYVASKSRSNYAWTFSSLTSSLNMEYVNYLSSLIGESSKDRSVFHPLIRNNKVMNFLKSKGYMFINFSSDWTATGYNRYADLNIQCGMAKEFIYLLMRETSILKPFHFTVYSNDLRKGVLRAFLELGKVNKIDGPKFIFVHIICPHAPYLFDKNGEPVQDPVLKKSGKVWGQKQAYLDQLIFIDKKVEVLIDEILSSSTPEPIIILQADHGSASTFYDVFVDEEAWNNPTAGMLKERFSIFNAYYLPAGGDKLLYDSITPVNTFRIIFNFYFDTDLPLLDDRNYFTTYENPHKVTDVTDEINNY